MLAITAATDVERLVLDDAVALAVLLLRAGDRRGSRAAARAVGRYALELPRVDLDELALLVTAFDRLAQTDVALGLGLLLDRRGLPAAREQLDRGRDPAAVERRPT